MVIIALAYESGFVSLDQLLLPHSDNLVFVGMGWVIRPGKLHHPDLRPALAVLLSERPSRYRHLTAGRCVPQQAVSDFPAAFLYNRSAGSHLCRDIFPYACLASAWTGFESGARAFARFGFDCHRDTSPFP